MCADLGGAAARARPSRASRATLLAVGERVELTAQMSSRSPSTVSSMLRLMAKKPAEQSHRRGEVVRALLMAHNSMIFTKPQALG
jgi:hypothetical protein